MEQDIKEFKRIIEHISQKYVRAYLDKSEGTTDIFALVCGSSTFVASVNFNDLYPTWVVPACSTFKIVINAEASNMLNLRVNYRIVSNFDEFCEKVIYGNVH